MTVPVITIEVPLGQVETLEPGPPMVVGFSGSAEIYVMVNGSLAHAFRIGGGPFDDSDWVTVSIRRDT